MRRGDEWRQNGAKKAVCSFSFSACFLSFILCFRGHISTHQGRPYGNGSSGRLGSVLAPVLPRLYLSVSLFALFPRPDLHPSFPALVDDNVSLHPIRVFFLNILFVYVSVAKFVSAPRLPTVGEGVVPLPFCFFILWLFVV